MTLLTLGTLALSTTGEVRFLASLPPDFVVNADGATQGQSFVLDERLRLGLALEGGEFTLQTEWDVFTGQLAGDPWDIPGVVDARGRETIGVLGREAFVPRTALVSGLVGPVSFAGGLQTSHWGLGMVANDGAHDPTFGRADFGDRVLRARFATRPGGPDAPLTVVAAFDRVVEDETATWAEGQVAWQGVFAARHDQGADHLGLYAVYRDQTEADGERVTRAAMLDGFAEQAWGEGPVEWVAAGEAAVIGGETSRARTYNEPDGVRLASAGATGFVGARFGEGGWAAKVRGGWASGDGDPDDDVSNDFAFDRDFDAGMVLFDEYAGGIEAATYAEVSDPENTGQTPDGAEVTVSEGAFRRATFVQPVIEARPWPWLGARVGVMGAWSTAPVANPFTTGRNGGVPTNHRGVVTTGRWLGAEIDWAVELTAPEAWALRPALVAQGGYARPSETNGNLEGDWLSLHTVTARARW